MIKHCSCKHFIYIQEHDVLSNQVRSMKMIKMYMSQLLLVPLGLKIVQNFFHLKVTWIMFNSK